MADSTPNVEMLEVEREMRRSDRKLYQARIEMLESLLEESEGALEAARARVGLLEEELHAKAAQLDYMVRERRESLLKQERSPGGGETPWPDAPPQVKLDPNTCSPKNSVS